MYQDKKPANWTLIKTSGVNKLYKSDGGAVKITREDANGDEKQVIMMKARDFELLAAVVEFITECAPHVAENLKAFRDQRDREKIKLQAQVQASKAIENLKAAGFTEDQIKAALLKQTA